MAVQPVTPVTLNVTVYNGYAQIFKTAPIKDASGTVIDFTTWNAFQARKLAGVLGPGTAGGTYGTVTGGSDGVITVSTTASENSNLPDGIGKILVAGQKGSSDDMQPLAFGNLTQVPTI